MQNIFSKLERFCSIDCHLNGTARRRINTMERLDLTEPCGEVVTCLLPRPRFSTCADNLRGAQAKSTTTRTCIKASYSWEMDLTPPLPGSMDEDMAGEFRRRVECER